MRRKELLESIRNAFQNAARKKEKTAALALEEVYLHVAYKLKRAGLSEENPRVIVLQMEEGDAIQRFKPSKFIRFVLKEANRDFSLGTINKASERLGETLPTNYGYSHTIIGGEELYKVYQNGPHASCMTGSITTRFYSQNNPLIRMILVHRNGIPFGRALLWQLENGRFYVDRVYPNTGQHVDYVLKVAREEGWLIRPQHRAGGRVLPDGVNAESLVTPPLQAPQPSWISTHSRGPFPQTDSLMYIKYSPDFASVQLGASGEVGWTVMTDPQTIRKRFFFCILEGGWYPLHKGLRLYLLQEPDGEPTVTQVSRWPMDEELLKVASGFGDPHPVFAPQEWATSGDLVLLDRHNYPGAKPKVYEHPTRVVQDQEGKTISIRQALPMHDGTYVLHTLQETAKLGKTADGRYVYRSEATYNGKVWVPNE